MPRGGTPPAASSAWASRNVAAAARAFGVSAAWLLTGKGDPLKPDLSTEELDLARRVLDALGPKKP